MNSFFSRLMLGLGLAAAATHGAEPQPKLVPRPLPGLELPQVTEPPAPAATPAPAPTRAPAPAPAPGTGGGQGPAQARILFIHRRATLPPQMTADLAKPAPAKGGQVGVSLNVVSPRPGKVRIIPKSEVAAFLAPAPPPKPPAP